MRISNNPGSSNLDRRAQQLLVLSCLALAIAGCVAETAPPEDASASSGSNDTAGTEDTADSAAGQLGANPVGFTMLVHVDYQTEEKLDWLVREFDALEHADRAKGYVAMLVEPEGYERLLDEGFAVEIQEGPTEQLASMLGGLRSIAGYSCYRTVEETATAMTTLESDYADLVSIVDIGNTWDKDTAGGAAGYDLVTMVVTNENIAGPKPRFFLMGSIHAREYATAELAIRFAEEMITGYGTDPDATWLLDNFELHVLPHANPDGRKIAEQGYTQRKNRNTSSGNCSYPPTASSQHGVDLNRNSSFKFGGAGTSSSACNLTYKRTSASEPETQALQSYMSSIFADQRGPADSDAAPADTTGIMITLHSYSPLVLFPWGWSAAAAPNLAQLRTLGRKFGYHNNYPVCQAPVCLYAASGTTDDWAYGTLGIAAYTFEVGTAFFQSCASFDSTVGPDNLAALRDAFKAARRPYQTPAGPDAVSVAVSASPVVAGTTVTLTATADDTRYDSNGWGSEATQSIAAARYTIDQPSWSGATLNAMAAGDGVFNATSEGVTASIDTTGWAVGRYLLMVEGQDSAGNWGAPSAVFLDVQ
jgi:carboxypeptidase T